MRRLVLALALSAAALPAAATAASAGGLSMPILLPQVSYPDTAPAPSTKTPPVVLPADE